MVLTIAKQEIRSATRAARLVLLNSYATKLLFSRRLFGAAFLFGFRKSAGIISTAARVRRETTDSNRNPTKQNRGFSQVQILEPEKIRGLKCRLKKTAAFTRYRSKHLLPLRKRVQDQRPAGTGPIRNPLLRLQYPKVAKKRSVPSV